MLKRFNNSALLPILALLPAFLGGATDRWSQGLTLLVLGLTIAISPPRHSLGRPMNLLGLGLLLCAAAAFLPAEWFGIPKWRSIAVHDLGLNLGSCLTPQPWMTLEASVLLAAGIAWFYYLAGRLSGSDREAQMKFFCAGTTLFAAISILLCMAKIPWPFWNANYMFGPFPNKNQTGNLLAVGAIIAIACLNEDFRNKRKTWGLWLIAAAVLLTALVMAGSRAAIGLFFAATITWITCMAAVRPSGARMAVGAGFILILWSMFLFGGGNALNRFLPSQGADFSRDLRWHIQDDALSMGAQSPWPGIGLGNFESQFWLFHRSLGKANFHVLHPESDWIWVRVEMGWLAVILLLCGGGFLIARILPLGKEPGWRLRASAAAAGLIFALHGVVDVSGHRLGTAFPALLMCGLALRPRKEWMDLHLVPRWLFRAAGVAFCVIGLVWLVADLRRAPLPGNIGANAVKEEAIAAKDGGAYGKAITLTNIALKWAPLDWELYYTRAIATAFGTPNFRGALADFQRARYLNPVSPEIPFEEGIVWRSRHPALTLSAWQEALKRAGESRTALYESMLDESTGIPVVRQGLKDYAAGDSDLLLAFLPQAIREDFDHELAVLLRSDPNLNSLAPPQKRALFKLWSGKADSAQFLAHVETKEEWMQIAWPFAAECHASKGDYRGAYELARRRMPASKVPQISVRQSVGILQKDFYSNPGDFARGYALYDAEMHAGAPGDALITLEKLATLNHCPTYFFALEADLYAASGKWKDAWEALKRGDNWPK